ncbi:MAG: 16S rRNA (guanine(527)-N(7))-methyltransferase RsmG [Muribaculaceae bacterium]|nr:16S rRNA (guanine(527)-N(7))-methyltransferase RsmG [Muribaculaceae bacterium]
METILKYFPRLSETQRRQLSALRQLYIEHNERVNVISRKDIDNLYVNHVLHSLAIGKFITPVARTSFIDLGCGGGFPGIPLAILWPECTVHLIDRIGKKVKVAQEVAEAVGLTNVTFQHGDSGECRRKFDFVVSRAVMSLPDLVKASRHLVGTKGRNRLPNGLICLKGGDLATEIAAVKGPEVLQVPLSDFFSEEYYSTKSLIYLPL